MKNRCPGMAAAILACILGLSYSGLAAANDPCSDISTAALRLAHVRITQSGFVSQSDKYPNHCLVRGSVNGRTGAEGRHYAISFELSLPADWNGRFLYQLNPVTDGFVVEATGDPLNQNALGSKSALSRGFAVLSSDSGHSAGDPANKPYGLARTAAFGLDERARLDYGYAADRTLGPIAKAIIQRHYGRKPAYSYMEGCSNGGRHVMVDAVRLAGSYDGFIAGDPAFNWPRAALQHAWDIQSLALADSDIRKSFSRSDMLLIAASVADKCDALDGVVDQMVNDLKQCQKIFHLSDLKCPGEKTAACLNAGQVAALDRAFGGPHNRNGEQLYSDWPYDTGVGARDWRKWKIGSDLAAWGGYPATVAIGMPALSYIFTTPPLRTEGTSEALLAFAKSFDFDRDAPKIYASIGPYKVSAMAFMTPPDVDNPELKALRVKGGKLIVYHGQSDAAFSVNDTIRWYEKLAANSGGDARSFARLFLVPGMNHCGGGPATDRFDMLSAIVNWVEKGKAPDRVTATVAPGNPEAPAGWSAERSRPLCAYPSIAKYKGGDKESEASFECSIPQ